MYIIPNSHEFDLEPEGGTVEYYDGIPFNPVTDTDVYGRVSVEKAKEFTLNMANNLKFVKEDGKYVIKVDYPEIPEGYQWTLVIRVFLKGQGAPEGYTPLTRVMENRIPREGSFTKVVPMRFLSHADRIQRELDEMKRVARRLESSVQAVDWDMAEKARLARQAQMARPYGNSIR